MKGRVMKSTGSWYSVMTGDKIVYQCRLRGKFKIQGLKVTNPIAVGDQVIFELEDVKEKTGIISEILPRENYIIRKSPQKSAFGHLIAANIDQAILMATLAFPRTSLGFIDRFLVTAETFRIPAAIVFNKADLLDEEMVKIQQKIARMYEKLGYKTLLVSSLQNSGVEAFQQLIAGTTSLLSGHSGVGKSTLINKIAPHLEQKTAEVSTFANKGVHTTTFAEMFEVANDTFIIDTPGIKELGLVEIYEEELSHYFPEMRDLIGQCKYYNCTHTHEPGCAIVEALEEGKMAAARYESYLSMLDDEDNRR